MAQQDGDHPKFTVRVENGGRKLKELIVHISMLCEDDPNFGAVKLNKILYYADFIAFERLSSPITGTRYFKLPQGPAPRSLVPVRRELVDEGSITIERRPVGGVYQERTIAKRAAALGLFTADELAIVNEVIDGLRGMTATEISEASHDIRWRALRMKSDMPYQYAGLSNAGLTKAEIAKTVELKEHYNW